MVLSVNAWFFPHYLAPFTCALYALILQKAFRHLRAWRPEHRPVGLALVRLIPLLCLAAAQCLRVIAAPLHLAMPHSPIMWYGTSATGSPRARIRAELRKLFRFHNLRSSDMRRFTPQSMSGFHNAAEISTAPK